jgi:hypothetical protein
VSRFSAGRDALRGLGDRIRARRGSAEAEAEAPAEAPPVAEPPSDDGPAAADGGGRVRAAADEALAGIRRGGARLKRELGSAARHAGELWAGVDVYLRRRLAIVAAAIAIVLAFVLLAVPALPCQYPGGDVCAPADDAAPLVPADALAYVHFDVDASTEQYRLAADDVGRIPNLSAQVVGRVLGGLPGISGSASRFETAVRPWLGDEAAVALLPAPRAPQEVELLAVGAADGARRYQRGFAGPGAQTVTYRGTEITVGRGGVTSAIVNGFLAIGTATGTRAVIDTATGAQGAAPLSDSTAAAEVRGMLPAERVADAYLSPRGVAAIAGSPTGVLSSLAPFFAPRATRGVAVGLVAGDGSLELEIRSALDPARAKARPGFFAAFPPFEGTLAAELPASTLAYLGIGEPGRAISSLLAQASTEEPGLARAITAVIGEIRKSGHVAVGRDLLPALGGEGALALEPAPPAATPKGGGGSKPSRLAPLPGLEDAGTAAGGAPYLLYLGGDIDPATARPALVRLEAPIARALAPGSGRPAFSSQRIAGVTARTLAASPTIDLAFAIVGGRLVIASNPAGVAAVAHGAGGLGSTSTYEAATAGFPASSSVLAYLDLRGLVALGEQAGLARSPAYAAFAPEIHRLAALGVSVTASPDSLATDARLVLGAGGGRGGPGSGN